MTSPELTALVTSPPLIGVLEASNQTHSALQSFLTSQTDNTTSSLQQKNSLLAQLAHLRTLHRQTTSSIRSTKALTASARSDVDSLHLTLQNLLYEQSHLRAEIDACESYSHPFTDLPLESLEDFYSTHPEARDTLDEHALTLARIENERSQREALEKKRSELVKRKQALVKENLKRKEDLQGLDGRMEAFIDAARPIEKVLGLNGGDAVTENGKDASNAGVAVDDDGGKDVSMG